MKNSVPIRLATTAVCLAAVAFLSAPAAAQSAPAGTESGKWQFTASIYGFMPEIKGKVNFAGDRGSTDIRVPFSEILSHLKMAFMGSFDAHNGKWGMFTDVLYMDIGGVKSTARDLWLGEIQVPATATVSKSLDVKAAVWTLAGEYRLPTESAWTVDLLAGARYLGVKPTLGYSITGDVGPISIPIRDGSKQIEEKLWDGIVGVKGRYAFGGDNKWFLPFYFDIGTGQTQLTWQAAGGIGYAYKWGEVYALYRYLDYNAKSGKPIADLNMGGPQIGVLFHW